MKLGTLLKQIPIHQSIILMEKGQQIAKGHSEYVDVVAFKDKTVGLITAKDNRMVINVYDRSK